MAFLKNTCKGCAIALATFLCAPTQSMADSPLGCSGLEYTAVPSVEGTDGMFYRILPDLQMDVRLSDSTIEALSALSKTLESRGTTLLFVPVPTKGLAHPEFLGTTALDYGFDVRIARALYADNVTALRAKGVRTVDVLAAIKTMSWTEPTFFQTDPRMTNTGLRLLAQAVSNEAGLDLRGKATFSTIITGSLKPESHDRFLLQLACEASLPELETPEFTTVLGSAASEDGGMVVIGSKITGGDGRNFAGFLADSLGRPVTAEMVGQSAYDAMAAYLNSKAFQADAPELIVWKVPVWENPAVNGDQPMRELKAAANNRCAAPTQLATSGEHRLAVDLSSVPVSPDLSLRFDTGEAPVSEVTFRFRSKNGETRTRHVLRRDEELTTHQVFLPLSGLWEDGVASVHIETELPESAQPSIAICTG